MPGAVIAIETAITANKKSSFSMFFNNILPTGQEKGKIMRFYFVI